MKCIKCSKEISEESIFCNYCGKKQTVQKKNHGKVRGNGTGTVYKRGKNWTAEITLCYVFDVEQNKKRRIVRRKSGFLTKKDALDYLPTLRNNLSEPQTTTVFDLHKKYISTKEYDKLSQSQKNKLGYGWNRCKSIWYRNIQDITVDDLNSLIEGLTFYPAKDIKTILSHIYTMAIKRDLVSFNKTNYIDMPALNTTEKSHFSKDEIAKMWESYNNGNEFIGIALLLIYTGMRPGELRSMKKSNIHLDENYMVGGIKTSAGRNRVIAIANCVMPIITKLYNKSTNYLLEISEEAFYENYHQSIEVAGVSDLNPYACRHTYFTRLAEENIQPAVITELGGHTSYQVTLGYTHIALDKKLAAVNKI